MSETIEALTADDVAALRTLDPTGETGGFLAAPGKGYLGSAGRKRIEAAGLATVFDCYAKLTPAGVAWAATPCSRSVKTTQPRFVACLIDISRLASAEFLSQCGGKLFMSGFYNESENVHCASLTPCYDFTFVEHLPGEWPEDEDAREELHDALLDSVDGCESNYYDVSDIERAREAHPERFVFWGDPGLDPEEYDSPEDLRKARIDAVSEALGSNPEFT